MMNGLSSFSDAVSTVSPLQRFASQNKWHYEQSFIEAMARRGVDLRDKLWEDSPFCLRRKRP